MKPLFLISMHRILMAALCVLTLGALLSAQSTTDGAIGGTIYDSNGAVIAKAEVVVRNNGQIAHGKLARSREQRFLFSFNGFPKYSAVLIGPSSKRAKMFVAKLQIY